MDAERIPQPWERLNTTGRYRRDGVAPRTQETSGESCSNARPTTCVTADYAGYLADVDNQGITVPVPDGSQMAFIKAQIHPGPRTDVVAQQQNCGQTNAAFWEAAIVGTVQSGAAELGGLIFLGQHQPVSNLTIAGNNTNGSVTNTSSNVNTSASHSTSSSASSSSVHNSVRNSNANTNSNANVNSLQQQQQQGQFQIGHITVPPPLQ